MKIRHRVGMTLFFVGLAFLPRPANAIDGFVVGGQVGQVGLIGSALSSYGNTIGFGVDLGIRTNPLLDLIAAFQKSSHGALGITSGFLSADFHFFQFNDFDFSGGGGAGFYSIGTAPASSTKFGLNAGAAVDVVVDERVRIGLGFRIHRPFGATSDEYWMVGLRASFLFSKH